MTPLTTMERLRAVEWSIERLREAGARTRPLSDEGVAYRALKEVAKDLGRRLEQPAPEVVAWIERHVDAVVASKHSAVALRRLGEEVTGRWPTIRRALEMACTNGDEETRG